MTTRTPDAIFARIARRYDLLNRILSFGREQAWRRSVAERLPGGRLLDLGSGTGAAHPIFGDRHVVALDPVPQMLERSPIDDRVVALGETMPFGDETFDAVFSAYVFRNLDSVEHTMVEIARLLRPGGRAGIVDLGRPKNRYLAVLHRFGSGIVLPIAGLLIGARDEYTYLHRSLDKLPPPEVMFAGGPLTLESVWRMGPFGFAHGVVLSKSP